MSKINPERSKPQDRHSVRILAALNFKSWIERHDLEAIASQIDILAVMESDLGREWADKGSNLFAQMRVVKKLNEQTGWQAMCEASNRQSK